MRGRGFCFLPAVGSIVLVSRLGGSNELYVAMFSEVDEVRLSVGESSFSMTAEGFVAGRRQRPALHPEQLIDAICALTVTTGTGFPDRR